MSPRYLAMRLPKDALGFLDVFLIAGMLVVEISMLIFFHPLVGMLGQNAFFFAFYTKTRYPTTCFFSFLRNIKPIFIVPLNEI